MNKLVLKSNVLQRDPYIDSTVFIARGAQIIGDVLLGKGCSVWYNAVLRADINQISIGQRSNIQDNSVIHLENDQGVIIGNDVTIGHNAIIHGCTIEDGALIGMGAIIMNGAKVGKGSVIGAGALIKQNMTVPDNCLAMGIPAKVIRKNSSNVYKENVAWAKKYVELAKIHKKKFESLK